MNNNELSLDDLNKVTGGVGNGQRMPGVSCPKCGGYVPVSIEQILYANSLCCPSCGYRFSIDSQNRDSAGSDNTWNGKS